MEEDRTLYRDFLTGNEKAFEEIMRKYQNPLIGFIYRYIKDLHDAEDIAIDVFCYLLIHPKRYNFKTELKTYLFMLAKSRAIDHLRRRSRMQLSDFLPKEAEAANEKALEEILLEKEIDKAVHLAIAALPRDMQIAVHLVYFEKMSYQDAARVMKKTPKQIDNLLYRAKEKMKVTLGKEGEALL